MILDGSKRVDYPKTVRAMANNSYSLSFQGDSIYIEGDIILNGCDYCFRVRMVKWDPVLRPPNTGDWGFARRWFPEGAGKQCKPDKDSVKNDEYWAGEDYHLARKSRLDPSGSARGKFVQHMREYISGISKEDWFISMTNESKIIMLNNELAYANGDIQTRLADIHKIIAQADDIRVRLLLEQKCLGA